jgi:hypothetical protein
MSGDTGETERIEVEMDEERCVYGGTKGRWWIEWSL